MSRPKGSKNRKTLEKMKMLVKGNNSQPQVKTNPSDKQKKRGRLKKENNPSVETTEFLPDNNTRNKPEIPKMIPKSNTEFPFMTQAQYDKLKVCKRCGKKIISDSYKIDTNILTAVSSTHRDTPRMIELCRDCAMDLSEVVDKWLLDGGYKSKWADNSNGY